MANVDGRSLPADSHLKYSNPKSVWFKLLQTPELKERVHFAVKKKWNSILCIVV